MPYHFFVHPDRNGKGPTLWGYSPGPSGTEIVFGSLEGPMRNMTKGSGYWLDKVTEKTGKGYLAITPIPDAMLPAFIGKVIQVRRPSEWNRMSLRSMPSEVVKALKDVRYALGLYTDHPSDHEPVPAKPAPRRASPEPTMVVRIPPKKTVSWMF